MPQSCARVREAHADTELLPVMGSALFLCVFTPCPHADGSAEAEGQREARQERDPGQSGQWGHRGPSLGLWERVSTALSKGPPGFWLEQQRRGRRLPRGAQSQAREQERGFPV